MVIVRTNDLLFVSRKHLADRLSLSVAHFRWMPWAFVCPPWWEFIFADMIVRLRYAEASRADRLDHAYILKCWRTKENFPKSMQQLAVAKWHSTGLWTWGAKNFWDRIRCIYVMCVRACRFSGCAVLLEWNCLELIGLYLRGTRYMIRAVVCSSNTRPEWLHFAIQAKWEGVHSIRSSDLS